MKYSFKKIESPVGQLTLVASRQGLSAILWENEKPNRVRLGEMKEDSENPLLLKTQEQLAQYFSGKRKYFDIDLDPMGTNFQKKVWKALQKIPFGETRSYKELAKEIGNLKAVRAVGAANGRNPISILVPCHRVIGASGKLTGFAGGLKNKEILLKLEGRCGQ